MFSISKIKISTVIVFGGSSVDANLRLLLSSFSFFLNYLLPFFLQELLLISFSFSSVLFHFFTNKYLFGIFATRVVADFLQQYDSQGGVFFATQKLQFFGVFSLYFVL